MKTKTYRCSGKTKAGKRCKRRSNSAYGCKVHWGHDDPYGMRYTFSVYGRYPSTALLKEQASEREQRSAGG